MKLGVMGTANVSKKGIDMQQDIDNTKEGQGYTPYEDVFRTLVDQCMKLVIPVINEAFHENYSMDDSIMLREIGTFSGDQLWRSIFEVFINDFRYFIKYRSNQSGYLEAWIWEGNFRPVPPEQQVDPERETWKFPDAAILYLGPEGTLPEYQEIQFNIPDLGEKPYQPPVIRLQDYSWKELFDKQLLFFLPYDILRYENQLKGLDSSPEGLQKLKGEYQGILDHLSEWNKQGVIDDAYFYTLVEQGRRVMQTAAAGTKHIKEELLAIDGLVLEQAYDRIFNAAREKGRTEAYINVIQALTAEMHIPLKQACQLVPEEARQQCYEILKNKEDW